MSTKHGLRFLMAAAMLALLLQVGSGVALAGLKGAIFTTDSSGSQVNGNIYSTKCDVYINGGPPPNAPCSAAGLPDGDYYFQVTNPSGSLLLSTDDISERKVTVSGGVITAYDGTTHATGTGACGSVTVALFPFDTTDNNGQEYKVWMASATGFVGFTDDPHRTDNFKVLNPDDTSACGGPPPPPPPPPLPAIIGDKFYDANANGIEDAGEVTIPGWKITITPPDASSQSQTFTAASGQYSFVVNPGTYTISEVMANSSWVATTATSGSVTTGSTGDFDGPHFGNVCLGGGGGLTLGFWSNKNGQALFTSSDLADLVALNLRNASGSNFDPATYAAFKSWLLSATATNMAYMLSAQMSAMELNVRHSFVQSSAIVYAPGCGSTSVNSNGNFISVGGLIAAANASLGADGLTLSGNPDRTTQECLKNALDAANNNRNFVQAGPCDFTTPY